MTALNQSKLDGKKIEDNVVVEEALDSVSRRNYTGHQKTQNALQLSGEVDQVFLVKEQLLEEDRDGKRLCCIERQTTYNSILIRKLQKFYNRVQR